MELMKLYKKDVFLALLHEVPSLAVVDWLQ